MKKDLHPQEYRPVVFQDTTTDFAFLTRSTAATEDTIKWEDGKEYPLVKLYISSASHPFYTGKQKMMDIAGRVDRYRERAAKAQAKKEAATNKVAKAAKNEDGKKLEDLKKELEDKEK